MYLSSLHGQGTSACARLQRHADAVHARHDALGIAVDLLEHRQADARHDPHARDDVGRVGELDANLRHRRPDVAHAVGQHVHRAPAMQPLKRPRSVLRISNGIDPVVGRPGGVLRQRADERPLLDASHVARIRPRVEAPGPQLLVEPDERAAPTIRRTARRIPPADPSTQCMAAGCVRCRIFPTQRSRWGFVDTGADTSRDSVCSFMVW